MNAQNSTESEGPGSADAGTWPLVHRLLREHVRRHRGTLAVAGVCMVVVAACTGANAYMMKPMLDQVFLNKDALSLVLIPFALFGVAVINSIANFGQAYLMNATGQRIVSDIQIGMFAHLMRADLAFFHSKTSGRLISNFLEDANLLRYAVARAITGMAKDVLQLLFLMGVMFYQNWHMALVAFAVFPFAAVLIRGLGKRMRRASRTMQERTGGFSAVLSEAILGARHVKAYGREAYETERAKVAIERRLKSWNDMSRLGATAAPLMELLGGGAVALIVWYGGREVISGTTTPGTFFSFITAVLLAYQPVKSLANLNSVLQEGLAAAQRIFTLLDLEPTIVDAPAARPLDLRRSEVRLENVEFAYGDGRKALDGVSITLAAGSTVALVGASGSGKSTVVNLIPRFYEATAGRVTIDGRDVRDVTLASLRGSIALVSQESSLFNDTVRANIAYGRALASEDEIIAAAKAAAAHEFITQMPQGYDTIVGEGGVLLSGGQRQRIAIARAMLKDAPILLLDEATSALDTESERQVQLALARLARNRTTLIVAHRLSTVVDANVIHVLSAGRVIESGTHGELLARNGVYAGLYAAQGAEEAPPPAAPRVGVATARG